MLKITIEIGKRIDASQLRVGLQCPDALDHRIYDPRLQPLDRHPPVPQGASGKNLDDDVALSFLLDQFGELDAGYVSRIPYGSDVGQSYRLRRGASERDRTADLRVTNATNNMYFQRL